MGLGVLTSMLNDHYLVLEQDVVQSIMIKNVI